MNGQDGMEIFLRYHRRLLLVMTLACALGLAALLMLGFGVGGDYKAWAAGFGAGAAAQLLKFAFVDVAAVRRMASGGTDVAAAQARAMVYSLVLFGTAVIVVYNFGGSVWAMAAGIFLPRLILVVDAWLRPNPFGAACK